MVATSIIGLLSATALPTYMDSMQKSNNKETQARVASIPSIVSAYIDATGELPTTWDDLSSIATVMTNNGPATGDLTTPIILPNSKYELSIAGPTEAVYNLKATQITENQEAIGDRYAIYSCFNVSNGASDLKSGKGIENQDVLNCG